VDGSEIIQNLLSAEIVRTKSLSLPKSREKGDFEN
jgi:hypothetical protein